tara:strand:+ start:1060 stop:1248 length:189 start_codon:yes stop_codon:yes gene_type:complete
VFVPVHVYGEWGDVKWKGQNFDIEFITELLGESRWHGQQKIALANYVNGGKVVFTLQCDVAM